MTTVVTKNEMGFGLLSCVFCWVVTNTSEERTATMFTCTLKMKGSKLLLNGNYSPGYIFLCKLGTRQLG